MVIISPSSAISPSAGRANGDRALALEVNRMLLFDGAGVPRFVAELLRRLPC